MVRLRQILHSLGQSLLLVPLLLVVAAIVVSRITLAVDGRLAAESLPQTLTTTVDGGRAMLTAIAGGLISSVTLLLSLMLVAVQLASSQFSPRTLHGWIGDRTQQATIGLVLATSVYCLLVLRETRTLDEGEVLIPHLSVLLAVALGVLSLIAVVRSVDHLTRSLRVGSVARSITEQTEALVHSRAEHLALERPDLRPATHLPTVGGEGGGQDGVGIGADDGDGDDAGVPPDAELITAVDGGWIQQIDEDELLGALPDGATARMAVSVGTYVLPGAPLVWVWPAPEEPCAGGVRASIAVGDERTMQEDIGYGILQLVDVAVRALSPGVNDPNTANDIIVNLGRILLAIWEYPEQPRRRSEQGRSLIRLQQTHGEVLAAAFGPLRHHGAGDPAVVATMVRMLVTLRGEVLRRELAGPVAPIDETIAAVVTAFEATSPAPIDRAPIRALLDR